jgi:adenylate cyclase
MAFETERKFLVIRDIWEKESRPAGIPIRQGYLSESEMAVVRIRIKGKSAFLTIKGKNTGITRPEFEFAVPLGDAEEMLAQLAPPVVSKTRYIIPFQGKTWEVDVFEGLNEGLILAEIELSSEDETFDMPDWVGEEVSNEKRYYNAWLAKQPFCSW